jgi:magnesium transporter
MSHKNHSSPVRRKKVFLHRQTTPGTAPGTIHVDPNAPRTVIRVMAFDTNQMVERDLNNARELSEFLGKWPTLWIDVTGLGSADVIMALGDVLGLHPLAMEDVVNVHQRSKVDEFKDYLFIVARMIDDAETMQSEQISFFLKQGLVVTFQERPGDCWEPVRQRLRQNRGRLRTLQADYLLYALLDSIIDSFFPVMELLSDRSDQLEEQIAAGPQKKQIRDIHNLRGQLLGLRKSLRPHREMVNELIRDENTLISHEARLFLRDCYDHIVQLTDMVDTYRDLTADLRDFYMSSINNNMNEVIKVLTIISTIFMPLSFVAGVYGMNFKYMPELSWHFGYPFALTIMASISVSLLVYFRRNKWI